MDLRGYEQVKAALAAYDADVTPKPSEGQDVAFFEISSAESPLSLASVLNGLREATLNGELSVRPRYVDSHNQALVFEDINVTEG